MSRFASTKLREIDLWEGEWVKIPTALSYELVLELTGSWNDFETSKKMLEKCIKEWNLKDEDGNIPVLSIENILKLDVATIKIISDEIAKLTSNDQDKKK